MRLELGNPISEADASEIQNEGERLFACACLEVGCEVYAQVPVGCSVIDFFVINPKAFSAGKLVEVTMEKREVLEEPFVLKVIGNSKKLVKNSTGIRKQRQIESMKESGHKWTILFDGEVESLRKNK